MTEKPMGEKNYEQFADRYAAKVETKPHNAYLAQPAMLSMLPDVNELDVLDAGCGSGHYSERFLDAGARVVAMDVTPRFVEIAQARLGDRAVVHQQDINQPFTFADDAMFDVVFCNLVLDYVEDWQPVFAEFSRVMRAGGWVLFSCGHPQSDFLYVQRDGVRLFGEPNYFEVQAFEGYWGGFGDPPPLIKGYRRSFEDMFNTILDNGFTLEQFIETRPTLDYKAADPEGYEKYMRHPTFVCMRIKKVG